MVKPSTFQDFNHLLSEPTAYAVVTERQALKFR